MFFLLGRVVVWQAVATWDTSPPTVMAGSDIATDKIFRHVRKEIP